jgi:hypothetical protein
LETLVQVEFLIIMDFPVKASARLLGKVIVAVNQKRLGKDFLDALVNSKTLVRMRLHGEGYFSEACLQGSVVNNTALGAYDLEKYPKRIVVFSWRSRLGRSLISGRTQRQIRRGVRRKS